MTKINVKHIIQLSNLPMAEEDAIKLEGQLITTLEHVDRLAEIDTASITGTNEVTHLSNIMREDDITSSLTQAEALMNAKKVHNGFFVVPVILEEAVE